MASRRMASFPHGRENKTDGVVHGGWDGRWKARDLGSIVSSRRGSRRSCTGKLRKCSYRKEDFPNTVRQIFRVGRGGSISL